MNIVLATNSQDRGSTSRTLEAWTQFFPAMGVDPTVTVGGPGPLLCALQDARIRTRVRPLRVTPNKYWPFPFVNAVLRLAMIARSTHADLIHVNEHDHHPVAAHAAALARVPLVTHLRFTPTADYCRWLFRPGRVPERLFFTSRTQMRDSAEALEPVVPRDRWRLISDGLDFSQFGRRVADREIIRRQWGITPDTLALGVACAISPRKSVDHFVRLIARLRAHGVNVHGFIAGQAHFPEHQVVVDDLQRLSAELGLQKHMTFLGYVEPIEPVYHAWDLCVSTSQYETFGMSVLEAMACECPVLAYPGGSVAEIVGDAASVVPQNDEDALYSEALRLVNNRDLLKTLGESGRRHGQDTYEIRPVVQSLVHEYQEVVNGARR